MLENFPWRICLPVKILAETCTHRILYSDYKMVIKFEDEPDIDCENGDELYSVILPYEGRQVYNKSFIQDYLPENLLQ